MSCEQLQPSPLAGRVNAIQSKLLRVLTLSTLIGMSVIISVAYYYGSVQTARDVLIDPNDFSQISFVDVDPSSGRAQTFSLDPVHFAKWQDHAQQTDESIPIFESAYRTAYRSLCGDHLALAVKGREKLVPLFTLWLRAQAIGPNGQVAEIDLQRIDFLEDRMTYRVTGRRDLKESENFWYFTHQRIGEELNLIFRKAQDERCQGEKK